MQADRSNKNKRGLFTQCPRCRQIRAALIWGVLMYLLLELFWL